MSAAHEAWFGDYHAAADRLFGARIYDRKRELEKKVAAMFGPWRGSPLLMLSRGVPIHTYWAHCDTSQSNANTALAIGHGEEVDGVVHVVIDRLQLWRPQDFPEHQINYRELEEELWQALVAFTPAELSFDQFQSASLISSLSDRVAKTNSLRGVSVLLKPAHASRNWQRAEGFKTALGMGQIHVPFMDEYGTPYPASELLDLEARFVQNRGGKVRPPTSGPVQTKDVLDALMEVTMAVQDENSDGKVFERLGASFNAPRSPGLRAWAGVDPEIDAQFEELRRGLQRRSDGRSAARGGRLHGGARRPRR